VKCAERKHAAVSRLRKMRRAGGPSRNYEEKVRLKRLSRMPVGRRAGDLAQDLRGARVVKQGGTAPSSDRLGGAVWPSEKTASAALRRQGW